MKFINPILTLLFVACFCACSSPNSSSSISQSEDIKEELITVLNTINEAFQKGDVQTLGNMITEDYVHTNGNAPSIDKETWLNYLQKRTQEIKSGELEVLNYNMAEMEIVFHAYNEGNPFFMMKEHPKTLRGETYLGASSAEELKQETLAIFKKYNVVKAVVSDGVFWDDGTFGDILLYGRRNMSVDSLRNAHDPQYSRFNFFAKT